MLFKKINLRPHRRYDKLVNASGIYINTKSAGTVRNKVN